MNQGQRSNIARMLGRNCSTIWFLSISLFVTLLGCTIGHGLSPVSEPQTEIGCLRGRVTFRGAWPDSTAEVRVAVYAEYPPSNFYLIRGFSDPIPIGVSEYEYTVSLEPGMYEWIIVVWRKEGGFWGPESLLGMYYAASDTTHPGAVQIEPGGQVIGIDIVADFEKLGVLPPEVEEAIQVQGG